jgi:hypothetical protein
MPLQAAMIDTHTYFKTLREAGFEERQAEAMTKGIAGLVVGSLATKADVLELRVEMNERFNEIEARLSGHDAQFALVDARFAAIDARFDAVDARFQKLENLLSRGLQRVFAGVIGLVGVFVALATYVGTHLK